MTFFECFAGIGGFRLGLERAGFKCIGSCEIDKHANLLYRHYFNTQGEYFEQDIKNIEAKELPEFDILCGGFPCQAFSIAGKQKGFGDDRGLLFFELARIAKIKKPQFLFFENVKNLLSHNNGQSFAKILDELWELGYNVEYAVLNSKNFGLPQHRERVFIIGYSREKCPTKILPIISSIAKNFYLQEQSPCVSTITARYTALANGTFVIENSKSPQKIGYIGKSDSQANRVYNPRGCSVTLKALGGGGGAKTGLYLIDEKIRRLTPRECFRLQGFPDEMVDLAHKLQISDTQLYKMAGNAVSVNVIEAIAKQFKEYFERK